MPKRPSRIDLLELDIDLRLADLWREAAGIAEWSLEVVAAFMRAAYGKGYCDALTEERPARSAPITATGSRRASPTADAEGLALPQPTAARRRGRATMRRVGRQSCAARRRPVGRGRARRLPRLHGARRQRDAALRRAASPATRHRLAHRQGHRPGPRRLAPSARPALQAARHRRQRRRARRRSSTTAPSPTSSRPARRHRRPAALQNGASSRTGLARHEVPRRKYTATRRARR